MKWIGQVLSWMIMGILILSILLFVIPRFFGVKLFCVLSGSMEPTYGVGDLLYAVPTKMEEIKPGDVITFMTNSQSVVVTHRVVKIDEDKQVLYTKGDANNVIDGNPTAYENVIGVVRFSIPEIGKLLQLISTKQGRLILSGVILTGVLMAEVPKLLNKK